MAGILSRFKTIMEANINALLDKAEDPVKMADQLARDLEKDLGEVKAETVSVRWWKWRKKNISPSVLALTAALWKKNWWKNTVV